MFQNVLAILGLVGGLLGGWATYVSAKGKNKTDIGAIVNEQIKTILENKDKDIENKDQDITELKEDNEQTKKDMNKLRDTVDKLNDKVEQLLLKRIEDQSLIGSLTFELKQKTSELINVTFDRDHWKEKYEKLKGDKRNGNNHE